MMTARETRAAAREVLRGYWPLGIITGLAASLLGGNLSAYEGGITINVDASEGVSLSLFNNNVIPLPFLASIAALLSLIILIYTIVTLIIGGAIQLGFAQFHLKLADGENPTFDDLFSQLHRIGAGFVLGFLTGLYVVLWTFLFIIPGIIASYSYSLAPYILAENPQLTPNEAISASKKMMQGHKWELFCLDLSFIGWALLCVLTLGLGYLVLNPYECAARTIFYRQLCAQIQGENYTNMQQDDSYANMQQNNTAYEYMPQMGDVYQENLAESSSTGENWYDTKNPYEDVIDSES